MKTNLVRPILLWSFPIVAFVFLFYAEPGFFRDPVLLGGLTFIEIVLASLWHYETVYFPLLIAVFVWAGTYMPFGGYMMTARWLVLAVGALAGAILWGRANRQGFGELHLAAVFATVLALVSAVVSSDPSSALLKVSSLFLLFLYGATGARLAIAGREQAFIRGLLLVCQGIAFLTAFGYAIDWPIWGNPNSLGAVMGVVIMPIVLWGFLVAETRHEKYRSVAAILTCLWLLNLALSRASIVAAFVSVIVLCVCLRRQRVLAQGAFLVVLLMGVGGVLEPTHFEKFANTMTENLLYKGKKEQGIFGSRQSPWDETVASLQEHPWFGTGWGTSTMGKKASVAQLSLSGGVYTLENTNREHGDSYLAMAEYVGFVGIAPFAFLLFLVGRMILQVCLWMRRTSNAYHVAVPLAMTLLAGMVHALFEDWMVAPGYYLCVFFWTIVFLLNDLMPERQPFHLRAASPAHPHNPSVPTENLVGR